MSDNAFHKELLTLLKDYDKVQALSFEEIVDWLTKQPKELLNKLLFAAVSDMDDSRGCALLLECGADPCAVYKISWTLLHEAVDLDLPDETTQLLNRGANVQARDRCGYTPLHHADSSRCAQLLLDHGADIEARSYEGKTPLHYITDPDAARLLIANGANVHAKTNYGHTTLFFAQDPALVEELVEKGVNVSEKIGRQGLTALGRTCSGSQADIVEALLKCGASIDEDSPKPPLCFAAQGGNVEVIALLLKNGANIDAGDYPPLCCAAEKKHKEAVFYLLENGASVNPPGLDWSPFRAALYGGDVEIVQAIINQGADVNEIYSSGKTPLHWARNTDCAVCLIEAHAELDIQSNYGETPLYHIIEMCDDEDVASLLIEKGANIHIATFENKTPLHAACADIDVVVASQLIANGASVTACDVYMSTPLHELFKEPPYFDPPPPPWFVQHMQLLGLIKVLIANHADVNALDDTGYSPLHYAILSGNHQAVELLIENGADLNIQTKESEGFLHFALEHGQLAIVDLLLGMNITPFQTKETGQLMLHQATLLNLDKLVKRLNALI